MTLSFDLLKKFNKQAFEYLTVQNWLDPPHQRILTLASHCNALKSSNLFSDDARAFLLGCSLSLLGLAMLEFSTNSLYVKEEQREEFVKQSLVGGRLSFYERKELLGAFYDFMVKEIETRYNQKYPVPKRAFVDYVVPSYAKYIADLVSRLCADPKSATYMPRIIDLIAHERILYRKEVSLKQVGIFDDNQARAAIAPASDLITFAARADLLDVVSKDKFDEALGELER